MKDLKTFYISWNNRGHKKLETYCQRETNLHNFLELKPVNSVVCEQTFKYTNHYTNLKVMNCPRYNFFWLYILDLHNHYVEDHRVQKVNPLSTVRMDQILSDMMISAIKGMEIWTCVKVLLCDISFKNKNKQKSTTSNNIIVI